MRDDDDTPSSRIVQKSDREWREVERADLVLGAIPGLFLPAVAVGALSAIPFHAVVTVAALLSSAVIGDALFRHPPGRQPDHGEEEPSD